MKQNNEKLCINVTEMANMLDIGRNKAYDLTHQADFPAVRLDGRIIIPVDALNRWLNEKASQTI